MSYKDQMEQAETTDETEYYCKKATHIILGICKAIQQTLPEIVRTISAIEEETKYYGKNTH